MPEGRAVPEGLTALIGAGLQKAGERLSLLLGRPLALVHPRVELATLQEAAAVFGRGDREAVAVQLSFAGDLAGQVLLLFEGPKAHRLAGLCLGQGDAQLAPSVLAEVGNIAAASFLEALADHWGMAVRVTPPQVVTDMAGAILGSVLPLVEAAPDRVFLVYTDFQALGEGESTAVEGALLVAPDAASLERMADLLETAACRDG